MTNEGELASEVPVPDLDGRIPTAAEEGGLRGADTQAADRVSVRVGDLQVTLQGCGIPPPDGPVPRGGPKFGS
eukprot:CAMPEP_0195019112 /NCGR_PEP_ID=MMETSP0326_2-20130528/32046_1 /TAXON_ID=2866 ORGANISM="Crypthecodinium cohnii, Strain Seligo" /NCGR_SAMPLE_ID=MMETSP0326_2 /ASSEMBLY_ACC=CAM_ASM_000348 /LENGTH=72 /DNA_ID=CAMNT_0040036991 /DNA_START=292 /DNA_END=510 /DNA_ORIENTATION=-